MAKVASYRELLAEQANAAIRISGAHHSSWNGQTHDTDPKEEVDGKAQWNHTIRYNDERIAARLREMFRNARVHPQDPDTLRG